MTFAFPILQKFVFFVALFSTAGIRAEEGNDSSSYLGPIYNNSLLEIFTLDLQVQWNVIQGTPINEVDGTAKHSRVSIYDSQCVGKTQNGPRLLQLMVGQVTIASSLKQTVLYRTARLESKIRILYGHVTWRARLVNPMEGVAFRLQLVPESCVDEFSAEFERKITDILSCQSNGRSIEFLFHNITDVGARYYYADDSKSQVSSYQVNTTDSHLEETNLSVLNDYRIHWTRDVLEWYIGDKLIGNITDSDVILNEPVVITMQSVITNKPKWPSSVKRMSFMLAGMEILSVGYMPELDEPVVESTSPDWFPDAEVLLGLLPGPPPGYEAASLNNARVARTAEPSSASASTEQSLHTLDNSRNLTVEQRLLKSNNINAVIAGLTTGAILVLVAAIFLGVFARRRRALRDRGSMRSSTKAPAELPMRYCASEAYKPASPSYGQFLEVPASLIEIGTEVLGRGQFGVVYKGSAKSLPTVVRGPVEIAIKVLTHNCDHYKFIEEFQIMTKTGRHINVLSLLGAVLTGQQCLLLEFCRHGSLLSFLRAYPPERVCKHVADSGVLLRCCSSCDIDRKNLSGKDICTDDLVKFGHQISRGMEHLASHSIIHRDLAARNVLVADNHVLKISDFGLAKHGQAEYMVSNMQGVLPVRWMPPEAILSGSFSFKSDVWSFGVVLWEIFSIGEAPFNTTDVAKCSAAAFAGWLSAGNQMAMPVGTPLQIQSIMRNCWNINPEDRHTFADHQRNLNGLISSYSAQADYLPLVNYEDDISPQYRQLMAKLDETDH